MARLFTGQVHDIKSLAGRLSIISIFVLRRLRLRYSINPASCCSLVRRQLSPYDNLSRGCFVALGFHTY
ncbi:uncharacterized protein LACBIDRAFT_313767 [Laccaria bicolor S238N-H82]|uniref:Predicted protein n=1 Tax=Laccaria bicolor (strain S238N-H82 / ATCC MYA-4686) TaxID=486041 RepID=B0D0S9_LACBS|nr:uncharacterized protein LACBIDRAFT_313767 [Laccaria bicolor S238N-H82]EDR11874.1 predicted protein [Laccaria bicolor S238N-H82]|eukprot:XP_001877771.1 predicted protein [Laccaria bicolor S238N-H82]